MGDYMENVALKKKHRDLINDQRKAERAISRMESKQEECAIGSPEYKRIQVEIERELRGIQQIQEGLRKLEEQAKTAWV